MSSVQHLLEAWKAVGFTASLSKVKCPCHIPALAIFQSYEPLSSFFPHVHLRKMREEGGEKNWYLFSEQIDNSGFKKSWTGTEGWRFHGKYWVFMLNKRVSSTMDKEVMPAHGEKGHLWNKQLWHLWMLPGKETAEHLPWQRGYLGRLLRLACIWNWCFMALPFSASPAWK